MLVSLQARSMLSASDLVLLQQEQYRHDQRNHSDITCLSKMDRMQHYGLHFAKYVGRLARGPAESKSIGRTITDTALICLSAANTLEQRLDNCIPAGWRSHVQSGDLVCTFADAAGRFADACEKMDHLEEFLSIARTANEDIIKWVLSSAEDHEFDLLTSIRARRKELSDKRFYISD